MNVCPSWPQQRPALLARIKRRYKTLTELIALRGPQGMVEFEFTRVEDPNRVLDQVAAEEDRREKKFGNRKPGDQLHLPYWAELWDSSLGMGQLLLRKGVSDSPQVLRGKHLRIMDLGCGMGLTGMVASSLGHDVLLADLEPPALLFARLNSMAFNPAVRARQLNWQTARLGNTFDVIVGADILYERSQWIFLEPFFREHLVDGGGVLLGEPGRQTGDDFPTWITARGWKLTRHEEQVATRSRPIRLFELRLE